MTVFAYLGDLEQVDALGLEIGKIRINITTLCRQIESTSNKLKLIDGKRDNLAKKKATLGKFQKLRLNCTQTRVSGIQTCVLVGPTHFQALLDQIVPFM